MLAKGERCLHLDRAEAQLSAAGREGLALKRGSFGPGKAGSGLVDRDSDEQQRAVSAASSKCMTLRGRVAKEGNHRWSKNWNCYVQTDEAEMALPLAVNRDSTVCRMLRGRVRNNLDYNWRPKMNRELEFLLDYGSPFSYLASLQLEGFAKRNRAEIVYTPILLGAVLRQREMRRR